MFQVPNKCRIRTGAMGSNDSYGNNGAFHIRLKTGHFCFVIASDSGISENDLWEHVSISLADRTPTWEEMCEVKDIFWDDEDTVMQLHPPKSQYKNCHPNCLHLWRPVGVVIPMPPSSMVAP